MIEQRKGVVAKPIELRQLITRMRIVPSMWRVRQAWLAGLLRHVGDHIAEFAFGAQRLGGDVDVLLAEHTIDAGQHTRQIACRWAMRTFALHVTRVICGRFTDNMVDPLNQ